VMLPNGQQLLLSGPLVAQQQQQQQQAGQETTQQARPTSAATIVAGGGGAPVSAGAGGMYYTYAPVHIGSGGEVLVTTGSTEVGLPGAGSGSGPTVAPTFQQIQQAAGPQYTVVMAPHSGSGGGPVAGQPQPHPQQQVPQQYVNIVMGPQQGMAGLSLPRHHHNQHQVHSVVLGQSHATQTQQQQGMHHVAQHH
jgi:hypothetical protein